jgi:molybdopterin-guanine dinucleotide biosynthesis protein A
MTDGKRSPGLLGVVLAGGSGTRLGGGGKAAVMLGGRPLAGWVAAALAAVADEVVVVAKPGSAVPPLDGVAVWREPAEPVHPLAGIAWALPRAGGRDVLVAAVDLPFCAGALRAVVMAAGREEGARAPALVAEGQPLLGIYRAAAAPALRAAVRAARPARTTVAGLGAVAVPVPDPERTLFNINTPEDLGRAEDLGRRARVRGDGRAGA